MDEGKEKQCGVAVQLVWKHNKSQLWIMGFRRQFQTSGVCIRAQSLASYESPFLSSLRDSYGDGLNEHGGGSGKTCTLPSVSPQAPTGPVLTVQPLSSHESSQEPAEHHFQVWGTSRLLPLHPNIQMSAGSPSFSNTLCTQHANPPEKYLLCECGGVSPPHLILRLELSPSLWRLFCLQSRYHGDCEPTYVLELQWRASETTGLKWHTRYCIYF